MELQRKTAVAATAVAAPGQPVRKEAVPGQPAPEIAVLETVELETVELEAALEAVLGIAEQETTAPVRLAPLQPMPVPAVRRVVEHTVI